MKRLIYLIAGSLLLSGLTACEDFLSREPDNKFSASSYFASESELEMYANGMLESWLPNSSETNSGDAYNDLIATKTSTDFYRPSAHWDSSKQGGWATSNWAFLRRVNYMLTNMSNAKGKVDENIYNHYEGVARFWRGMKYVSMINTFSDVPWVEKYLQPNDSTILYGPRDDREYVFHKVAEDLQYACTYCMADKFHTDGRVRIDKFVVNALASRYFLYEATFRMNVQNNPATGKPWTNEYESVEDLLNLAAKCAKTVIDEGDFSLIKNYSSLFLSASIQKDEVIWGRSFSGDLGKRHSLTRYFHSSTLGQQYSGTKDLVDMFLKVDGTPIDVKGGEDKVLITDEFTGRDPRLAATILGPGHAIINSSYPYERIDFTFCKTGYMICKWSVPDESHFQNSLDENSLPIVRYAEVLLNYAEAMNELGQMSQEIWNKTVGALRTRAGIANIYPGSGDYSRDEWLYEYYTKDLAHPITTRGDLDIALEIRRERVTELTFEDGLRQLDVYRYGQGDLIARRHNSIGWKGIYVGSGSGFSFENQDYTFEKAESGALNGTTCYPISAKENAKDTDWFIDDGYLVYKYDLQWENKMYCRPIPVSAQTLNPKIGQNYGWN
ncbi:MAG: RagB/SusD family nutrient uptake outer membrane protein [Candidatus Cryptobacteroides sp.]